MNRNSTKPFWISTRIGRWYPRQWKKNWGTVTLSAVGMFGEGAAGAFPQIWIAARIVIPNAAGSSNPRPPEPHATR